MRQQGLVQLIKLFPPPVPQCRRGYTITPVPLPAAAWLFGSGLATMIGIARRKIR
ncbi:MAG: VPLPA-CTERM sorting domain-containing protein [Nitrospira sp.]|nr:VPLPA-CTERM sorting domain-containing protein [Nitrospira sp.]